MAHSTETRRKQQPVQLECEQQLRAEGFRPELRIEPPDWHWSNFYHEVDEYVWILSGHARLAVNGETMGLTNGDRVLIPARSVHSLENTGSTSLVWLAAFREGEWPQSKNQLVGEAKSGITFRHYAQQYLEWAREHKRSFESDRCRLRALIEHFGPQRLGDISPIDIERFKIERRQHCTRTGKPHALSSVNRELRLLHHILALALQDGLIRTDPMNGKVTLDGEKSPVERILTEEEETRLLAACVGRYEHLRPMIICALYTGMCWDEILSLQWADIDFTENFIHVRPSKTGKPRAIHMTVNVRVEIERLRPLAAEPEGVFNHAQIQQTKTSLKRRFRAVCKAAGIGDLRFQDLRHTFATRLARSSGNIVDVARVLGYARVSAAMRYAQALPDRLAEAMDRLVKPKAEIVLLTSQAKLAI